MLHEAALAGGTSPVVARMMYAAVWLGGPRWDDPERDLSGVSQRALRAEFARCVEWMERVDPSIDEVEAWMEQREAALLHPDDSVRLGAEADTLATHQGR